MAYKIIYSFVDRDMFMQYRGGAVGHKTTCEETKCLLDDRDKLDQVPFELESEQDLEYEEDGSDVEMGNPGAADDSGIEDDGSDDEGVGSEGSNCTGREESDDGNESDGNNGSEDMVIDLELLDEMNEFGYSGLDQVEEEEDGPGDGDLADDAFGAEDGENMGWDEAENELARAYL